MNDVREHIKQDTFPDFIKSFMKIQYPDDTVPKWIKDALAAVNVNL